MVGSAVRTLLLLGFLHTELFWVNFPVKSVDRILLRSIKMIGNVMMKKNQPSLLEKKIGSPHQPLFFYRGKLARPPSHRTSSNLKEANAFAYTGSPHAF